MRIMIVSVAVMLEMMDKCFMMLIRRQNKKSLEKFDKARMMV